MPPLHMRTTSPQAMLHKNMGSLSISTQSLEHQSSSIYSPATSVGSSSPESNIEMVNHLSENENGHDSDSMSEDMNQEFQSPLEQLRSFALKNNGDLSQGYSYHSASSLLNASADQLLSAEESYRQFETGGYLECHVCKYVASTQEELMKHVDNHFPFKCSYCNYTARTEGRLKHHESKFHSQTPPECWTGNKRRRIQEDEQTRDVSPVGSKTRVTKCKLCNFVGSSKVEYYDHLKQNHTDTAKLLYCDQCRFVTPYKHHLEYHLRNHFGSKPFKCNKCNYKCVNQSMLNSHQKSHSNVYQFRCANCSYATKYCHSLKTHLKKYNHTPGPVLNADGTPNSNSIIDIHGRRRGPKPKRRKNQPEVNTSQLAQNSPPTSHANNFPPTTNAQPILYHPNIFNNFAGTMYPMDNANCVMFPPNPYMRKDNCQPTLKCHYCDFTTESQVSYHQHLFLHVARDNSDLMMRYNLNADMYQMHTPQFNYNYVTNGNKFAQGNIARFEPAQESVPRFQQSTQGNMPMTKSVADEPKIDDVLITEPSTEVVKVEPVSRPSCPSGNTLAPKKASDQNGNAENPLDLSNKSPSSMDKLEEPVAINVPINYTDNLNTDVKRENDTNPARNRRKGKAFKLNHYLQDEEQQYSEQLVSYSQSQMTTNGSFPHQDMKDQSAPKSIPDPNRKQNSPVLSIKENAREEETESSYSSEVYRCSFCDIIFGDSKMYNKHKAYHSPGDPFTCGLCGVKCRDRVTLFDHFTFVPHFK